MKAFLHIHNDGWFCDTRVMAEVDLPCQPIKGSTFWMARKNLDELNEMAHKVYDDDEGNPYKIWRDRYGDYLFEEAMFVFDSLFMANDEGEYELHIELFDEEPKIK